MIDRVLALIVDEGKWLTASMALALLSVVILLRRQRRGVLTLRSRVLAAMNLAAGITIASMAAGHLLAVSIKLALATLRQGSLPVFIGIGVVLLVPAVAVVRHTRALLGGQDDNRATVIVNGWLAISLLALGLHNLPLAAPALFTIAYRQHRRPMVGWAIVGAALAFNIALFAASLIFLASGQSFEQFSGIEPGQ